MSFEKGGHIVHLLERVRRIGNPDGEPTMIERRTVGCVPLTGAPHLACRDPVPANKSPSGKGPAEHPKDTTAAQFRHVNVQRVGRPALAI